MWGDADNDVFVFAAGMGADEIGDFTHGGDRIDLSALGVSSFSTLQTMMSQNGANTVIDLGGGNTLTLDGVDKTILTAADFGLMSGSAAVVPLAATTGDTSAPDSIAAIHGMIHAFDPPTELYAWT